MKSNYSHIGVVLDRSASMGSIAEATISGFNVFLEEQQKTEQHTTLSLVGFDHKYEVWRDFENVKSVPKLTSKEFKPRGSTALRDAIGKTIKDTGAKFDSLAESERPANVLIVIITDGEENSSREYSLDQMNQMIAHQRDVYNWNFLFLGADQDAIAEASKLGIDADHAMSYRKDLTGTRSVYRTLGTKTQSLSRNERVYFTPSERSDAMGN